MPLLVSGMTKEVETLRDQLIAQNELAEANAAKVRELTDYIVYAISLTPKVLSTSERDSELACLS